MAPPVQPPSDANKQNLHSRAIKVWPQAATAIRFVASRVAGPFRRFVGFDFAAKTGALLLLAATMILLAVGIALLKSSFAPQSQIIVAPFEVFVTGKLEQGEKSEEKPATSDARALADFLVDDINKILDSARTFAGNSYSSKKSRPYIPDMPHIPVKTSYGIEIKGVSLDQIIATWEHLRFHQFRVSGDLILGPDASGVLRVRYASPTQAGSFSEPISKLDPDTLQQAVSDSSLKLVQDISPQVAAIYLISKEVACTSLCSNVQDKAVQFCKQWTEREPSNAIAFFYLGYALSFSRYQKDAISVMERATQLDPGNPNALNTEGVVYDHLGRFDDAAKKYRAALGAASILPAPLLKVLAWGMRIPPNPLLNLGFLDLEQGNYSHAERYFRRTIAVDNQDLGAYVDLGYDLIHLSRNDEAIKAFRAAQHIAPGNSAVLNGLVLALVKNNQVPDAVDECQYAQHLAPEAPEPVLLEGEVYLSTGDTQHAIEMFQTSLTLSRGYHWADVELARAYLHEGDVNSAESELAIAERFYSNWAGMHFLLAQLLKAKGDSAGSESELSKVDSMFKNQMVEMWW